MTENSCKQNPRYDYYADQYESFEIILSMKLTDSKIVFLIDLIEEINVF